MKQYLDILRDVYENGIWKEPAREGMPRTKEVFCRSMRFDLSEGFPLLTTKKMFTRAIVTELLWFLRGGTNIKYLVDNGNKIWIDDAYKFYKRRGGKMNKETWLEAVKAGKPEDIISYNVAGSYSEQCGYVGRIYGSQWRNFGSDPFDCTFGFDQIHYVIHALKDRPNERYHIIDAWNPIDYLRSEKRAALPACHVFYQFCVREGKLDMMMLQRSCDTMLGVPFDLAMCGLLLHLICLEVGLEPGEFVWVGNSVHLYENHLEQAAEQLSREPLPLCQIKINKKDNLENYELDDIEFINYQSHPAIKAPLSVGV